LSLCYGKIFYDLILSFFCSFMMFYKIEYNIV